MMLINTNWLLLSAKALGARADQITQLCRDQQMVLSLSA